MQISDEEGILGRANACKVLVVGACLCSVQLQGGQRSGRTSQAIVVPLAFALGENEKPLRVQCPVLARLQRRQQSLMLLLLGRQLGTIFLRIISKCNKDIKKWSLSFSLKFHFKVFILRCVQGIMCNYIYQNII